MINKDHSSNLDLDLEIPDENNSDKEKISNKSNELKKIKKFKKKIKHLKKLLLKRIPDYEYKI